MGCGRPPHLRLKERPHTRQRKGRPAVRGLVPAQMLFSGGNPCRNGTLALGGP